MFLYPYNYNQEDTNTDRTDTVIHRKEVNKMMTINRTTENKIANITTEYMIDNDMYFINGYMLTEDETEALYELLEDCEHINESMDADTFYGFDDEYIVIDWYGEDI